MDTMAKSFFVKSKKGIKYRIWKSTKSGYWYIELRRKLDKSLKTKKADQAKVVAQAMANELDGRKISVLTAKSSKTISQYLDDYISDRSDLSTRTTNLDRTAIKCLIDVIGDIKVATIRPGHIKSFRKIHEYYIGPGKKKVISKTSVNTYLRHIKTFLRQAHLDGILLDVPMIKMVKTDTPLPRVLSPGERKRILDHTFKEDYEFHRVINFALYTGCRRHEIVSARWENYDWANEMIRVFGKGGKERQVPIIHEALFAMGKRKDNGTPYFLGSQIPQ